jgi:hypothetical protein
MRHRNRVVVSAVGLALVALVASASATVPISGWGAMITESNTTYVLTGDLVEPASTQGIDGTVAIFVLPSVHDIVIDGQGFTIDGQDQAGTADQDVGIRLLGLMGGLVRGVVIRDVVFEDVATAIRGTDDLCDVVVEDCEFVGGRGEAQITFSTTVSGAAMRWITVRDSWIHDVEGIPIRFLNGGNAGGGSATMEHLHIVGNVIHDHRRSQTAPAPWNGAILLRHGASRVRVRDNVVLGGDGLSGLVLASEGVAGDTFDDVSIRGNHLGGHAGTAQVPGAGLASGMTLDGVTTASGDFASWEVSGNYLYMNEGAGIEHLPGGASPPVLPADGNWWGEDGVVSGAYANGAVNATDGAPRDLLDGILALPDAALLDRALADNGAYRAQVILLNQNDGGSGIRGFDVDYDFVPGLSFMRAVEGPFLARQAPLTQFYDIPRIGGSGNERTASGAILGGSIGAVGNGALYLSVFRMGPEDLAPADDFFQDAVQLRDPGNFPVTVLTIDDADWRIDDTPPTIQLFPPGNNPCVSSDTAWVEILVSDNFALEDVSYRAYRVECCEMECWVPLALDESGTAYTGPNPFPVDVSACEGNYLVEVRATDDAGNVSIDQLSIYHDTTAPAEFAGVLTADTSEGNGTPFQGEIAVTWNGTFELGGDLKLRYLPYGGAPGFYAYPEYDDEPGVDPHFPGPGEGTEIDIADVGSGSLIIPFQISERSMYYFSILVEDCAGNSSPGAAAAVRDSALSYYLGDFDSGAEPICATSPQFDSGNGEVNLCDLISFSLAYATVEGDPDYHPEADIGPTVPGPGPLDGVPLTDNQIAFDDLILFAINFGTVSPFAPDERSLAGQPSPTTGAPGPTVATSTSARSGAIEDGGSPHITWPRLDLGEVETRGSRLRVPVVLTGNAEARVKGIQALLAYEQDALRFVTTGSDIGDSPRVFIAPVPGEGVVSIDLAVLGETTVIAGDGVVAWAEFEAVGEVIGEALGAGERGTAAPRLVSYSLRDRWNRDLAELERLAAAAGESSMAAAPGGASPLGAPVFGLRAPVPNPFNPSTRLPFAINEPGLVALRVFDARGRLVRELWNRMTAAGPQSVVWDGRADSGAPVASGLYFAELHAGSQRAVQKLVLLR